MKIESVIFGISAVFILGFAVLYWLMSGDWTGTTALVMTVFLMSLVFGYLRFHAGRMQPRPEDRQDAEIADGAGELGFFPPYSWWPLWCALCLTVIILGPIFGWWLLGAGVAFGALAVSGLVFEYYRGEHAH